MALTAVKEADEIKGTKIDFERALRVMRQDVKAGETESASVRGDLSAAWKIVEDECHVNKAAAKVFRKQVLEADDENKDDFLRSLYGLMKTAGLGISQDLVDRMSDTGAPTMPIIKTEASLPFPPAPQNAKPEPRAPFDDAELENIVEDVPDRGGLTVADVDQMDNATIPPPEPKRARGGKRPQLVTVN